MEIEHYPINTNEHPGLFEFTSSGVKGHIKKIVAFQNTAIRGIYNLAFGDRKNKSDQFDDIIITNNGDAKTILATLSAMIYVFTERNPDAVIYFKGSTSSRTRLYKMAISKYFNTLNQDFEIYRETSSDWEPFDVSRQYIAFLIKRKMV